MSRRVLITGGAGFLGSHVADELLRRGHAVRALDALLPQVHGPEAARPAYLDREVELHTGDVRDPEAVRRALDGVDVVVHLAAAVGVGQSMYRVVHYASVNDVGTAVLLEALAERPVARLVVASSMSLYGEGLYRDAAGVAVEGTLRPREQLERADWELRAADGAPLQPVPTPETKRPDPASVYALTKLVQERLAVVVCGALGIPALALRLFNVYGPRQALSNPYTGVLAIFASRLRNQRPPIVFEDGRQQRDFVNVRDVARAFRLAVEADGVSDRVLNVGSGAPIAVSQLASLLAKASGAGAVPPRILARYRAGDVRHCFADISEARRVLGYAPRVPLDEGLAELAEWVEGRLAVDRTDEMLEALERRRLAV